MFITEITNEITSTCNTDTVFVLKVVVTKNRPIHFVLAVKATNLVVGINEYSIVSQCAYMYIVLGGACTSGGIYPADGSTPFTLDSASGNLTLVQMVD